MTDRPRQRGEDQTVYGYEYGEDGVAEGTTEVRPIAIGLEHGDGEPFAVPAAVVVPEWRRVGVRGALLAEEWAAL
jgi:hypothetical protein